MTEEKVEEKKPSAYRMELKPGEEQRRLQWNLILVSNIPVTVDFYHTDMLEKVISITGAEVKKEEDPE